MYANMEKVIKEYDKRITTFYGMNIQQAGEIYENSKGIFEMIHKAFKFGFGQGMKYQKKRGKVNKNGK
uniref:Uncharacterized protein n=1 Tax=Caudovirales sp. ct3EF15 TaxID=2826766 RepID=A0A8S5MM97_9CAUD|nr:MAG TPA: hypothetical protein [Caudovirales sp. ct3EF15]